jgi:putative Holliday junction resolvase
MARLMAIDYGIKRTGIAVTDELKIIATALTTVETNQLMDYLKTYFAVQPVERLIVGDPSNLNGTPTHATQPVKNFVKQLSISFPELPVSLIDERYTSKMASQVIAMSGKSKKERQNKGLIDQISAVILLQDYMTRIENQKIV